MKTIKDPNRSITVPLLAAMAALAALTYPSPAHAEQLVHVDFESLAPGDSVEGLGAVHPLLDINAGGNGAVLGEDLLPTTYGGGQPQMIGSGCLGNPGGYNFGELSQYGQGFADLDRWHDYLFSFAPGTSVSEFSISMVDFGDFNPNNASYHEVRVSAYDADGYVVDDDVLAFDSTPVKNPPEYRYSGDACWAWPGEPGNYTFHVSGSGIAWVVVEVVAGIDPNIAFDDIAFTACEDLDADGVCDDCDACPGTVLPETAPSFGLGTNRYVLLDEDGVFDTRLPNGMISPSAYTLIDTHGCSCEQIIEACGAGGGHQKHGCSVGIIEKAIDGQCFDTQCTDQ